MLVVAAHLTLAPTSTTLFFTVHSSEWNLGVKLSNQETNT